MAKGLRIVAEEHLKSADIALQELELQKQGILARKKDIYRDATEYGYEVSGTFTEEAILFKALLKVKGHKILLCDVREHTQKGLKQ